MDDFNHDFFFEILQYNLNITFTTRGNMKNNNAFWGINCFHNRYTIISLKNKSQIGDLATINTVISFGGFQGPNKITIAPIFSTTVTKVKVSLGSVFNKIK